MVVMKMEMIAAKRLKAPQQTETEAMKVPTTELLFLTAVVRCPLK
jgi:hypothetical protein